MRGEREEQEERETENPILPFSALWLFSQRRSNKGKRERLVLLFVPLRLVVYSTSSATLPLRNDRPPSCRLVVMSASAAMVHFLVLDARRPAAKEPVECQEGVLPLLDAMLQELGAFGERLARIIALHAEPPPPQQQQHMVYSLAVILVHKRVQVRSSLPLTCRADGQRDELSQRGIPRCW